MDDGSDGNDNSESRSTFEISSRFLFVSSQSDLQTCCLYHYFLSMTQMLILTMVMTSLVMIEISP